MGSRVHKLGAVISRYKIRADRYLDLGCGDGEITMYVSKLVGAREVYGIDIQSTFLKRLPRTIKGIKANLNYAKLPFPDNYFQLVTAFEVIEHLTNTDNLIKEALRVLDEGGYFIISTPNLASWLNRLLLLLGFQPAHTEPSRAYNVGLPAKHKCKSRYSGHLNLFTLKALEEMLSFMVLDCLIVMDINLNIHGRSSVR
jgi:ubiquinone/menaquinone biosynthesis C-methylase UbiE